MRKMTKVRKVVIPAAGLGTRFLPTTLAVAKELLPLDRRPAIHHNITEAVECGIDTVVLVLSRGKEALAHYFMANPAVEKGVNDPALEMLVEEVRELRRKIEIVVVYQHEPLGLGHAVLCAANVVGNEAFALMLPDDNFQPSPLGDLVAAYEETGLGGIALKKVSQEETSRFGIVEVKEQQNDRYLLCGAVEKPPAGEAPSDLAIMGRYVLPGEVFELLRTTKPGAKGEIQITDALHRVARDKGLMGLLFNGTYLDLGTWEGYVLANARTALADPALAVRLRALLEE
jgi:UTP--glucose-1-phosphate uridylyltransferase